MNGTLTKQWIYKDQLNPIAEIDATGAVTQFIYGESGHVPSYMIKAGIKYRIITDHLGSVRMVVNADIGTIAQQISYDEFGQVLSDTNPGFQPFGFVGGLYDSDTTLVRFGARDYDAYTGRWTAKDAIRFNGGTTNLYEYVGNDPINFVDVEGELAKGIVEIIAISGVVICLYNIGQAASDIERGRRRCEEKCDKILTPEDQTPDDENAGDPCVSTRSETTDDTKSTENSKGICMQECAKQNLADVWDACIGMF